MKIVSSNSDIEKDNIKLQTPIRLQGGTFLSNIQYLEESLLIQTPKCIMKQGIVTTGRKKYMDLCFSSKDSDFIDFLETLERKILEVLEVQGKDWFEEPLSYDDISYLATSILRPYKQNFYLLRVFIQDHGEHSLTVFDENQEILLQEDLEKDASLLVLLDIHCIKFSSSNFRFEILAKQLMTLEKPIVSNKCMIQTLKKHHEEQSEIHNADVIEQHNEKQITLQTILEPEPVEENQEIIEESLESPSEEDTRRRDTTRNTTRNTRRNTRRTQQEETQEETQEEHNKKKHNKKKRHNKKRHNKKKHNKKHNKKRHNKKMKQTWKKFLLTNLI